MMLLLLLLAIVGSMVDTARHVGQSVAVVSLLMGLLVGGGRVLTLRPWTVLTRGSRSGNTSGSSTTHGSHPVHVVLLGRVHQVSEQIIIRKVGVINQSLKIQRYLLCGQLGQLSVRMFSKMFNSERVCHVGAGIAGVVVIAGIGVIVVVHCTVAKIGHLLNFGLLRRGIIGIHWWRLLRVLHGCNLVGYF